MVREGAACNAQSNVFTIYTIESDLLNGKHHYTSRNGAKALAYDSGDWNLQSAEKRSLCNGYV